MKSIKDLKKGDKFKHGGKTYEMSEKSGHAADGQGLITIFWNEFLDVEIVQSAEEKAAREKLIEQAQQIAENGCPLSRECDDCVLNEIICPGLGVVFNDDVFRQILGAFLAGIAFEKGEL